MTENPFEQSTLNAPGGVVPPSATKAYAMSGPGVMLKPPPMLRVGLPIILMGSGFTSVAAIMFSVKDFPLNLIVSIVMVCCEASVAAFFWFYYNAIFVCADDNGVTKSQWGKATTVPWAQIASIESLDITGSNMRYTLKDSTGEVVMEFVDFSDSINGAKLRDFIAARAKAPQANV